MLLYLALIFLIGAILLLKYNILIYKSFFVSLYFWYSFIELSVGDVLQLIFDY